jgi:hypothetical protein
LGPPFATALLPNRFGTPVYCSLQRRVNALGCISFHPGQENRMRGSDMSASLQSQSCVNVIRLQRRSISLRRHERIVRNARRARRRR